VVLISQSGDRLRYVLQLHFQATNNGVEYEALLHDMRVAASFSVTTQS
jgi:ribonuclease HI